MTDKQIPLDGRFIPIEQAIKIGLISEKDINVPSKRKIMYDYNAKDCEQCNPDSVCCYCKNITCYELEKQLKRAEQKLEKIKEHLETISYLAPFSTRTLKHTIKQIIEE